AGSRFAPVALRGETVLAQENYSPYFRRDLADRQVHDAGDVEIIFGNRDKTLQRIEQVSRWIVSAGKIPFFIGGEHLITLPAITPLIEKFPDLRVLQLDAHLDLIDALFGDRISHGTVMRRIHELMGGEKRIYQLGIRSGSPEEYAFAAQNTRLGEFDISDVSEFAAEMKNNPLYITVDLDVFDPSLLPGTGTPEAGGIFFPEFIKVLKTLQTSGCRIVGADMVELSPQIDPTGNSTVTASKILREMLVMI
ncbi:MAG: agmatinase, partial [Calditrichia bacterium]